MIGVIMTSWGRADIALRTLNSLVKTRADMRIVVIDCDPENKLAERLLPMNADFALVGAIHCIVAFDRNMGKGYGQNLGRAILRENCEYHKLKEPEYYLLIDDDVVFREGWLDIGLKLLQKNDYPMLSFYRGGSDHHHFLQEVLDDDAKGYRFGIVNKTQGICWLLKQETAREIGDIMTWRPISGIDSDLTDKLDRPHLAIDGLVKHIGFGHSTHRGELYSWDKQKAWDDKIEERYGQILGDFFNRDYFVNGAKLGISAYDECAFDLSNDVFIKQADMLIDILNLKGKTVCELGCALGNLIYYLREKDIDAFGEDISMWAWKNSYAPLYHHIGDAEQHIYTHNVDVMVSFHTFEHISDPPKAIQNCCSVMKEGGIFFAVIPSDGHEHDPTGVSMHDRDWWHARLTENGFIERKDLHDKFFWHKLVQTWNWEVYCYERS